MITVEVIFADGDSLVTMINATHDEARSYYLGKVFNIGSVRDNLQKCVDVKLVS